ncbi:MAG: hypothetical protein ACUVRH_03640 [Candidatus Bipolaricaulia bacterium]
MRKAAALAWLLALLVCLIPLPSCEGVAKGLGLGVKLALYPFGFDQAFGFLRVSDFLGVEGLTAILEGGLGLDLRSISLDAKLLLTRFPLDGSALIPFTGGGIALELGPRPLHEGGGLTLIPEGLAGVEFSLPPLLLLGELRVRSLRGMAILLSLALEF